MQGLRFSEIIHPDDLERSRRLLKELTEGKRAHYQVDGRFVRLNGNVFWGRLTASYLDLEADKRLVALVEDIDTQKRYKMQLRSAKKEAEEAARLKSVMLANMSHEVRTPLTSMIGFSEILKEQLDGKAAKLARLIYSSGQRLEATMGAVLQFSQLEGGGYTLDRERLCLTGLIEEVVDEFAPKAADSGVSVRTETGGAPVEAYVDKLAVRHVLTNLLDNAIKFTSSGGRVTLRAYAGESHAAVVEVEDTGEGIAEAALPRVFEPFKQESEGFKREYEGAGLGLSIVRKIVEALDGQIDVDTEKGVGTCMTVRLPRPSGTP